MYKNVIAGLIISFNLSSGAAAFEVERNKNGTIGTPVDRQDSLEFATQRFVDGRFEKLENGQWKRVELKRPRVKPHYQCQPE